MGHILFANTIKANNKMWR